MGKLSDLFGWLKSRGSSGGISTDVDLSVESSKCESQGTGKSGNLTAKRGASISIDNSVNNYFYISSGDLPAKGTSDYRRLVSELKNLFEEKQICFVDKLAADDIRDYNSNPPSDDAKEAMKYLATIAPEQDILYMETGIYVKSLNERGEMNRAKRVRDQASRSSRARNIINLASAGFMEGYVAPICQASGDDAKKIYDEIVEELPGIVFVNSNMDVGDAMNIIERKIENREKYHWEIDSISVNGLNHCMDTIEKIQDEVSRKYPNFKTIYKTDKRSDISRGELKIILREDQGNPGRQT